MAKPMKYANEAISNDFAPLIFMPVINSEASQKAIINMKISSTKVMAVTLMMVDASFTSISQKKLLAKLLHLNT